MADLDHSPDYPFGCGASWGDTSVHHDGGEHICNLSNAHHGQPHECKCGATSANPQPPPGPPATPRCRECGGPRSVGGAIRYHESDCQRGKAMAMRAEQQRAIEAALIAAVRERRQDTAFMDRLAARIAADGVLLERLAAGDRWLG